MARVSTGLALMEQETVIRFDREKDTANIYTADGTMINKLDKIYKRSRVHKQGRKITGVEYEVDKKLIQFRAKRIKRTLSDEQKAQKSAAMKLARAKRG